MSQNGFTPRPAVRTAGARLTQARSSFTHTHVACTTACPERFFLSLLKYDRQQYPAGEWIGNNHHGFIRQRFKRRRRRL